MPLASIFNQLGQYVNSPGNMAYCYAKLGISSLEVSIITTSNHYPYPRIDGQAGLAWVAWLNTKTVYMYLQSVSHLSTNLAQCETSLLMFPTVNSWPNCHLTLRLIKTHIRCIHQTHQNTQSCQYIDFANSGIIDVLMLNSTSQR